MASPASPTTPSPPKDLDIFGKELGLNDGERQVLAGAGEVFLKKVLHVDTHSKKGEPTEPKTLVLSSSRCFVLSQRPSAKVDVSFSFLKIQQFYCSEKKIVFHVGGEVKPRDFHASKRDAVEIAALITAQLKNVFPITPLELILQLKFDSDALQEEVTQLRDNMLSSMDRVDAASISGFMTSYGFICDFFGVPLNKEVSWYLYNVYLAHGFRDLKLADFDHLSTRDVLPVLSTLRHNHFFEGIIERDSKMMPELFEELSYVLNTSHALKKIVLSSCGMRPENLIRLSTALKNNPRTALTHLDVSDNLMDDKAIECLGTALESLSHGLQELNLANCKITPKAGTHLANCMKQNKHMQYSLVKLDLSSNPLGPDPLGSLAFIQEPQTMSTLDLSKCNLSFEFVMPVLNRGCQQHLRTLNLSYNAGKSKKGHGPTTVSALQQFCSSAISIDTIRLADCRLTNEAVCGLLEGLAVNPNVASVDLDVSSNDMSAGRDPPNLAKVLVRSKSLRRLNLSDCGLDNFLPVIVDAVAGNSAIKHLAIGKNFNGKQTARQGALDKIAALLKKEDCHLQSLCLDDSRLKEQSSTILDTLAVNSSLIKLSIGGCQMGNRGARCLAKALLTNYTLKELEWDHNDTTLYGFQDVADSLEHNYTLRVMPLPLFDIARGGRPVEAAVQRMQALLSRNHSDERLKIELAARHRGRLLTTTQQSAVVSRELVQLEDLVQWAESVYDKTHPHIVEALEVKEQANNVVKLTDGLYSPQVESEQFETITHQVKLLLDSFIDKVFEEHVQANTDRMVAQSNKACSKFLSPSACSTLGNIAATDLSKDLTHAKKAVGKKASPEVINHVSAVNLDIAASISELVVEQTLTQLEKTNAKLIKLRKASRNNSTTPDTRVSRNFTFRVQQEEPVKKKRSRRPDTDDEEVSLPSSPLGTDGPELQHLGKSRPKPARMQRQRTTGPRKPSVKATDVEATDSNTATVNEEVTLPETITEAGEDESEGDLQPAAPVVDQVEPQQVVVVEEVERQPTPEKKVVEATEVESGKKEETPSPAADVIEVGLSEDIETQPEPETDVGGPTAAEVEEVGLPNGIDGVDQGDQIEPATIELETLEEVKQDQSEKTDESPPVEELVGSGQSERQATPAASPKPLPKPRATKPQLEGDAEHKELVQAVSTTPEDQEVKTPDIIIESGSPAKKLPAPEEELVTPAKGEGKKRKSKKGNVEDDRPLTPSSEGEEKGDRRPSKERRRSGFAKLFGKPKKVESDKPAAAQRISAEWEVLGSEEAVHTELSPEAKPSPEVSPKPRPPVKEKPRRANSLDIDLLTQDAETPEKRVPVGGIATANMSELASVLKKGRGTQLRPARPQEKAVDDSESSKMPPETSSEAQALKKSPVGPPKPKPKPRPTKKAASTMEVCEGVKLEAGTSEGADGTLV